MSVLHVEHFNQPQITQLNMKIIPFKWKFPSNALQLEKKYRKALLYIYKLIDLNSHFNPIKLRQ
jgi:hypothetical protein